MINKMTRWGFGVAAATASLGLFVATASAQLAPPPAAPKAPAATTAPAPAVKAPAAAVKAPKKAASACKGLAEADCKANAECSYIVPTKVNAKTGKAAAAYCRKTAGIAKKAAAPAAAKAPAAAAPAAKAPAAAPAPAAPKAAAPAKKS